GRTALVPSNDRGRYTAPGERHRSVAVEVFTGAMRRGRSACLSRIVEPAEYLAVRAVRFRAVNGHSGRIVTADRADAAKSESLKAIISYSSTEISGIGSGKEQSYVKCRNTKWRCNGGTSRIVRLAGKHRDIAKSELADRGHHR